jgi:hypothetical protein
MKMIKMNTKSLILGLLFAGGLSFVNAQTTQQTDTQKTVQNAGNATIEGLKNKLKPIQKIPMLWQN